MSRARDELVRLKEANAVDFAKLTAAAEVTWAAEAASMKARVVLEAEAARARHAVAEEMHEAGPHTDPPSYF